jgi:DNA-directed RNA polymerase specialized sigma24 family protein
MGSDGSDRHLADVANVARPSADATDAGGRAKPAQGGKAAEAPRVPPVERKTFEVWFKNASLRESLLKHVCFAFGVNPTDADDIVQDAYIRAHARPDWPGLEEKMLPWMKRFAFFACLTYRRKKATARKRLAFVDDVDVLEHEPPRETKEAQRAELAPLLRSFADESAENRRTVDMLEQRFDAVAVEAIAARYDTSAGNVYGRTNRLVSRLASQVVGLDYASAIAIAVAVVCLIGYSLRPKPPPNLALEPAPGPSVTLPAMPTHTPVASALRAEAKKTCDARAYVRCVELLDGAQRLDAEGDKDPAVQKMRKDAQDWMKAHPDK